MGREEPDLPDWSHEEEKTARNSLLVSQPGFWCKVHVVGGDYICVGPGVLRQWIMRGKCDGIQGWFQLLDCDGRWQRKAVTKCMGKITARGRKYSLCAMNYEKNGRGLRSWRWRPHLLQRHPRSQQRWAAGAAWYSRRHCRRQQQWVLPPHRRPCAAAPQRSPPRGRQRRESAAASSPAGAQPSHLVQQPAATGGPAAAVQEHLLWQRGGVREHCPRGLTATSNLRLPPCAALYRRNIHASPGLQHRPPCSLAGRRRPSPRWLLSPHPHDEYRRPSCRPSM